jgi:hypothetical protein
MPASESSNALIVPSAGHELGHTVWRIKGLYSQFEERLKDCVVKYYRDNWPSFKSIFGDHPDPAKLTTDMLLISYWTPAFKLASRQSEECFCDFLGIRLFGDSFLHSFEYLIAPNLGQTRAPFYPPLVKRAKYMVQCATALGFSPQEDFPSRFSETHFRSNQREKFVLEAGDAATEQLVPELIRSADLIPNESEVPGCSLDLTSSVYESFKNVEPAFGTSATFQDIVNAAWKVYLTPDLWPEKLVPPGRKFEVLSELALKSIEVLEFQTCMADRNAS